MLSDKLAHLAAFSGAIILIAPAVRADFHIFNCEHGYGLPDQTGEDPLAIAVPSNQYNCNGVRNNPILDGTDSRDAEHSDFSASNLCGYSQINFYPNGGSIPFYQDGGNGQVLGTCYPGGHGKMSCPGAFEEVYCSDDWVCYSSVCS